MQNPRSIAKHIYIAIQFAIPKKIKKLKIHTSHFCCFILFVLNLRDDQDFSF